MIPPESSETPASVPPEPETPPAPEVAPQPPESTVREYGGRRDGTDPTRFGDWEKGGRCIDF